MDYHEIVLKGPFYIEEVTSLPTTSEKKRMVYYNGSIYYNNGSSWKSLLSSSDLATSLANYSLTTHTHAYLEIADNLSDLANVVTARTNLGLGTAAVLDEDDFAADDHTHAYSADTHTHDTSYLQIGNNLSELATSESKKSNSRLNLGLGNNATVTYTFSTDDPTLGSNGDVWYIPED